MKAIQAPYCSRTNTKEGANLRANSEWESRRNEESTWVGNKKRVSMVVKQQQKNTTRSKWAGVLNRKGESDTAPQHRADV